MVDRAQWPLLGATLLLSVLLGLLADKERHAILESICVGVFGAVLIICYGYYYRGVAPPSDRLLATLLVIGTGATVSGFLGWVTNRLATLFRTHPPRVALRRAAHFILLTALKLLVLAFVLNALGLVAIVDFRQARAMAFYYELQGYFYPYIAFSVLIVFVWSVRYSRRPHPGSISTPRLVVFRVAPLAAITLLFLPIATALVEVCLAIPLLECPPIINDSSMVMTNMIDYTVFMLNNLARGVGLDIGFYSKITACIPHQGSLVGSWLAWVFRLAPGLTVAWLVLRAYRLRT